MKQTYDVVYEGGSDEIVEKKSRFIAHVFPVHSEQEALEHIEQIRKQYWDARHNCHAFVIGPNDEISRCSDDGEPSGTAGRPILEVLQGRGIHNALVIVTVILEVHCLEPVVLSEHIHRRRRRTCCKPDYDKTVRQKAFDRHRLQWHRQNAVYCRQEKYSGA